MRDVYRPLTRKKHALVVVLAALTFATIWLGMAYRPGSALATPRAPPPDAARCVAGQTTGCVGGMAAVIAVPAAASAAPAKAR